MSYDFDAVTDKRPLKVDAPVMHHRDLEAIVVLIHLAAIELTPTPGTKFTFEELLREMWVYGGDEIHVEPIDVRIVLRSGMEYIKKVGNQFMMT